MKYLITGGAGFIGSHLSDFLLSKGEGVVAFDNISTGNINNLSSAMKNKNFRLVKGSILDIAALEMLVKECDVIFHLAAAVGVKLIVTKPLESIKTNVHGTENVLELALKYKKKVIIASSSEVYGKNTNVPLNETDDRLLGNTHITRWNYSCAKALDEFMALGYYKELGLDVIIVRFFNIVGERQSSAYGMVIPTFLKQAASGKQIIVHGDGSQTRTFCYVKDVAAILYKLSTLKVIGEVFNIGSSEEISIIELAKKIKKITNSKSEIVFVPYANVFGNNFEDTKRRVPDISKLKKAIGQVSIIPLEVIIKEMLSQLEP